MWPYPSSALTVDACLHTKKHESESEDEDDSEKDKDEDKSALEVGVGEARYGGEWQDFYHFTIGHKVRDKRVLAFDYEAPMLTYSQAFDDY